MEKVNSLSNCWYNTVKSAPHVLSKASLRTFTIRSSGENYISGDMGISKRGKREVFVNILPSGDRPSQYTAEYQYTRAQSSHSPASPLPRNLTNLHLRHTPSRTNANPDPTIHSLRRKRTPSTLNFLSLSRSICMSAITATRLDVRDGGRTGSLSRVARCLATGSLGARHLVIRNRRRLASTLWCRSIFQFAAVALSIGGRCVACDCVAAGEGCWGDCCCAF